MRLFLLVIGGPTSTSDFSPWWRLKNRSRSSDGFVNKLGGAPFSHILARFSCSGSGKRAKGAGFFQYASWSSTLVLVHPCFKFIWRTSRATLKRDSSDARPELYNGVFESALSCSNFDFRLPVALAPVACQARELIRTIDRFSRKISARPC
jgi:hypothetical protein